MLKRNDESMSEQMYAYLCLSGRLRFLVDPEELLMPGATARYGIMEKGDWFGMVAMYTDTPQSHRTVLCDRYSDIAIVPRYLISVITSAFREAAGHQVDYMARCIHRDHEHTSLDTDKMQDSRYQVDSVGVHTWRTFRMVCVYPASPDIPAKLYCDELARHHASEANVVTREMAMKDLKISEFNSGNEYTLAKWLVLQEEKSTVLFVIADNDFSDTWNTTVAKICDMLQVLVTYSIPYKPDENEIQLLGKATKARKELVFIHPVIRVTRPQVGPTKYPHLPHGSMLWLRPRPWVQRHHHVRMLDSALRYTKEKNPEDLKKYWKDTADPDKHNDFGRVMRWVSGQSVGLILGGGGAKGAAHIGALNYLLELDVPVDYIAGVSIGSFLGALYAVYENIQVVEAKAKELWEQLRNPVRYLRDVSPFIFSAAFRGHAFSATLMYFFGSLQMEDLYIPYFCVSTDLHGACARTHMSGDLWFYVRASMTLTMIFPPQINQFDDHLLMDGGYSDLVPAMAMRRLGIKYLVAINIGHDQLMNTFNVGYHVSGLHCILQNLLPYSNDTIPHNFDIWDSLLYILKAMDEYCIYIRPNINAYTALDFKNYDELRTAGYLSTKCKFGGLHMKQLPVHIIWYLLRFYTYPSVALSQAQILQGFTDEDWAFAVKLMSKTQMYQRATNTFLKMNLTPYLTDLMEARSYLEGIINQEDVKDINLNVPVLENFSRDDERLDLVHAIARMKEWTYMEDFDNIVKETSYGKKVDFKIKTKLQITGSQGHDIKNARESKPLGTEQEMNDDLAIWSAKQSFSIKDLFKADPTLFHAVASFSHLQKKKSKFTKSTVKVSEDEEERSTRNSDIAFHRKRVAKHRKSTYSLPSIPSIGTAFAKARAASLAEKDGKQNIAGQRLMEFRKCLSRAERYN
ncbi:unnamed protein product [Orchesella dallaii]|uniref:Neuropathy target esterase sws n=1 Tax=Orchesella dallaii TaxID=48710 RepID=A0ABP1RFK8_9HEXA